MTYLIYFNLSKMNYSYVLINIHTNLSPASMISVFFLTCIKLLLIEIFKSLNIAKITFFSRRLAF